MTTTSKAIMTELAAERFEWAGRKGTAVASDLGLRAGQWPENLWLTSARTGSALRFERSGMSGTGDELQVVSYLAVSGGLFVHLDIFND